MPITNTVSRPPNSLAKQYDADKERLVKSCFSKVDQTGQLLESYITHVRVTEDSHYPSARPPPDSPANAKKPRVIIIAVRKSGRVRMHKARENPNGTFQIGKTWNLDDMTSVENDLGAPCGFTMHLGKPYYWATGTPKEKTVFVSSAIRIYRKYRNGAVPTMIGWDSSIGSPMPNQSPKFKGASSPQPGLQPGQSAPLQPGQSQPMRPGAGVRGTPPPEFAGSPPVGRHMSQASGHSASPISIPGQSPVSHYHQYGSPASNQGTSVPRSGYDSPSTPGSGPYAKHTRGRSTASIGSAVSIGSNSSAGNSIPGHARRRSAASIEPTSPVIHRVQSHEQGQFTKAPASPIKATPGLAAGMTSSQSAHNVRSMVDPEPSAGSGPAHGLSQSKSMHQMNRAGQIETEAPPVPQFDRQDWEQQQRQQKERAEQERQQKDRQERQERLELERKRMEDRKRQEEAERKQEMERQRLERERLDNERREKDRIERERQEHERLEMERHERERQERARKDSQSHAQSAAAAAAAASAAVAAAVAVHPAPSIPSVPARTPRAEPETVVIEDSPSPPTAKSLENRQPTIPVISVDEPDEFDMDSPNPPALAPMAPPAAASGASASTSAPAHGRSYSEDRVLGAGFVEETPHKDREPRLPEFVVIDDDEPPKTKTHQRSGSQMSFESNLARVDEGKALPKQRHQKKVSLSEPSTEGLPSTIAGGTSSSTRDSIHRHRRHRSSGSLSSSRRLSRDLSSNKTPITYVGTSQADSTLIEDTLVELNWSGNKEAKALEADINRELGVLEESNIAHVIDLDTKLGDLTDDLDTAIAQCDELDAILTFFSVELGGLGSDIDYIESQGHGLQVQTTNQKILWEELNSIIDTMSVPSREMEIIRRARLDTPQDVAYAETALIDLFAALSSVRNMGSKSSKGGREEDVFIGNMRALQEKRSLYEQAAVDFIARAQTSLQDKVREAVVSSSSQLSHAASNSSATTGLPTIPGLIGTVNSLFKYAGIVLFVRDVDPSAYAAVLKQYERSARDYYEAASTAFFARWKQQFKASDKTDQQSMFSPGRETQHPEEKVSAVRSLTMKRSHSHQNVSRKRDVSLSLNKNDRLQNSFSGIVEAIQSALNSEQEVLIQLFHMTSFGATNYNAFVKQFPASQRLAFARHVKRGVDPDRENSRAFATVLSGIFAPFSHECLTYFETVMETRPLECPTLFAVLDAQIEPMESTNQNFLLSLVAKIYDRSVNLWKTFVARQVDMINNTHVSCKRRSGVVSFVACFPEFCEKVEQQIPAGDSNGSVRTLVNDSYDKLGKAIFHNLQRASTDVSLKGTGPTSTGGGSTGSAIKMAASSLTNSSASNPLSSNADHEDKEILNYHILIVENMNCLMDALQEGVIGHSHVLIGHRDNAVSLYRTHLSEYSGNVLRRPFGKIIDYVEGVEALLKKDPSASPTQKHSYNKKAIKAVISSCSPKDVRKVVEVLRKRVEKHFGASAEDDLAASVSPAYNDELLAKVWGALQAETVSVFNRLNNIISKYFADTSVQNDVSKAEIQAAFRR